jgi:hypothetical protein
MEKSGNTEVQEEHFLQYIEQEKRGTGRLSVL